MNLTTLSSSIKRANQRLRQLEKSGKTTAPAYEFVKGLIQANKSYMALDSSGRFKFRTDIARMTKENVQTLRALSLQVDRFLNAQTSTVSGIAEWHKKSYETFKNIDTRYSEWTREEFDDFFKSSAVQHAMAVYGSEQIIELREEYAEELSLKEFEKILLNGDGKPLYTISDDIMQYYVDREDEDVNINDWINSTENENIPFK